MAAMEVEGYPTDGAVDGADVRAERMPALAEAETGRKRGAVDEMTTTPT